MSRGLERGVARSPVTILAGTVAALVTPPGLPIQFSLAQTARGPVAEASGGVE